MDPACQIVLIVTKWTITWVTVRRLIFFPRQTLRCFQSSSISILDNGNFCIIIDEYIRNHLLREYFFYLYIIVAVELWQSIIADKIKSFIFKLFYYICKSWSLAGMLWMFLLNFSLSVFFWTKISCVFSSCIVVFICVVSIMRVFNSSVQF